MKEAGSRKQKYTFFLKVIGAAPYLEMNGLWMLDEFLRLVLSIMLLELDSSSFGPFCFSPSPCSCCAG